MAKPQSRKAGRKNSRKNSRKTSKNYRSRRNRRSHQLRHRKQRGGMAPFAYKDAMILDHATQVQAQTAGLTQHIAESQVLARQGGGRRSRRQRGGELASFDSNYELLPANVSRGVNPQFETENSVNPLFSQTRGAQ
jgi:hypothetical protein